MASSAQPVPKFAYVGSYTTKERNARGEGINVYRIDPPTGTWTHVQLVGDLVNPSWLTLDRRQQMLYSAHGDGEVVTACQAACPTRAILVTSTAAPVQEASAGVSRLIQR